MAYESIPPGSQSAAYWRAQTAWSFDPSNSTGVASDGNVGTSDSAPLRTYAEWFRRVGAPFQLPATQTWRVLSDAVEEYLDFGAIFGGIYTGFSIQIQGVPTVLFSGTLTGVASAPWTVADTGAAGSWSNRGGVSCVSSATRTRLIRRTTGNVRAAIKADLGANVASISPSCNAAEDFTSTLVTTASFAPGDAYQVLGVPITPQIRNARSVVIRPLLCDLGSFTQSLGHPKLCGFTSANGVANSATGLSGGGNSLIQACYFHGGSITVVDGRSTPNFCSFANGAQFAWYAGDLNTCVNEFVGGLRCDHSTVARLGTIYVFDAPVDGLLITNTCFVAVDGIHGSGNSGPIINIRDPGCQVQAILGWGQFDATTSAGNPLMLCGVAKAYATLGTAACIDVQKNAGFFG